MAKAFLIDLSHCNGCYNCQIVCKDEHCDADWRPYAAPQPETGQFWMRVDEKVRGQVPWVRVAYTPTLCAHCADAPCAKACSDDAFVRRDDGLILIDPDKCEGSGLCVQACPQGAIFLNEELRIAQKCTGCAHLLDAGWEQPRCVDACAHDAIQFKDEEEFGDLLLEAEPLASVAAFGPKVYYLHLPKRFVAGSVVDFAADEVLIGARVELLHEGASVAETWTDDLGDFRFDQVEPHDYRVRITAEAYATLEVAADLRERDLSLDDLAIERLADKAS
ncbi:MAG: carboxypeptidase regulatory-like domain-containing protein [Coriobacteriales bacterium]|jgi:Fe-S-cluster-containing dehydrogenase component|nr:carboxypeptidase regulatory-like domain-containing protein [Coriobacteriales bacterium]